MSIVPTLSGDANINLNTVTGRISPPESPRVVPPFLAKIRAHHLATLAASVGASRNSAKGSGSEASSLSPSSSYALSNALLPPPNALYLTPPAVPRVEEDLVPPENFASVCAGVYRSGFPKKRNFKFMETLQLKTVLTLVLEDYPEANLKWCQSQDVQFMQYGIPGNKEPFDNIPEDVICSALVAILDKRNHPLLIHCNKGKHRTGCLIGCIRRLQSWSLTSIFDEYRRFSFPKSRAVDQQFIDLFDIANVWEEVVSSAGGGLGNLPHWDMLFLPRRESVIKSLPNIETEEAINCSTMEVDSSGFNLDMMMSDVPEVTILSSFGLGVQPVR